MFSVIQVQLAGTFSGFRSRAITQLNYANPVQLNDSSNNRLSAERWLFLWGSLVFPGIWMAQALAQAIHGSLWKQRDNLFVRRPFHAWLQRCLESLKTFRPPLLRFFFVCDSVIGCSVFLLCWLGGVGGHIEHRCIFFSKPVNKFCCHSMQAGRFFFSLRSR